MDMQQVVQHLRNHFSVPKAKMAEIMAAQEWFYTQEGTMTTRVLHKMCEDFWGTAKPAVPYHSFHKEQIRFCPSVFKGRVTRDVNLLMENKHYLKTIIDNYGHDLIRDVPLAMWISGLSVLRSECKRGIVAGSSLLENNYFNMVTKYVMNSLFVCYKQIDKRLIVSESSKRTLSELKGIIAQGRIPVFVNVDDIAYIGEEAEVSAFRDYSIEVVPKLAVVPADRGDGFGYAHVTRHYGLAQGSLTQNAKANAMNQWDKFITTFERGL